MEILVIIILLCIFGMLIDPVLYGLMQAALIAVVILVIITGGCSAENPPQEDRSDEPRPAHGTV